MPWMSGVFTSGDPLLITPRVAFTSLYMSTCAQQARLSDAGVRQLAHVQSTLLHLSEKSGRLQCRNSIAVARKAAVGLAMSMPAICNENRRVGVYCCKGGHYKL